MHVTEIVIVEIEKWTCHCRVKQLDFLRDCKRLTMEQGPTQSECMMDTSVTYL